MAGSDGSAFESYEGSQHQTSEQQRLQSNAGLELPALFHEGRRASDGLMCQAAATAQTPTSPRRVTVQDGVVGGVVKAPLLSDAHREHKALCEQYGRTSPRPVLRQVSYKLAQQQPVLLGTPVSAQCHPIAEADGSGEGSSPVEVSPDHDPDDPRMTAMMMKTNLELDEWCTGLPSSLAACDLNLPIDSD